MQELSAKAQEVLGSVVPKVGYPRDPRLIEFRVPHAERWRKFAEVVPIIMLQLGEPSSRFTAVSANIKNLIRVGAVPNPASGKGRAGRYSEQDVVRIILGMELHAMGFMPSSLVGLLDRHIGRMSAALAIGSDLWLDVDTAPTRTARVVIDCASIAKAISSEFWIEPTPAQLRAREIAV